LSKHTLEIAGCEVDINRWGEVNSEFRLSFTAITEDDRYELSNGFSKHSKSIGSDTPFQPEGRGDWTLDTIDSAVERTIQESRDVDLEDVAAIVDLTITEERAFIDQPWENHRDQLARIGQIPDSELHRMARENHERRKSSGETDD
jgi:hypothetical protein